MKINLRCSGLLLVSLLAFGGCSNESAPAPLAFPDGPSGSLEIKYPLDETLFPPEIVAPTFVWSDKTEGVKAWTVLLRFDETGEVLRFPADRAPLATLGIGLGGDQAAQRREGRAGRGRRCWPGRAGRLVSEHPYPDLHRPGRRADLLPGGEPAVHRRRQGPARGSAGGSARSTSPTPPPIVLEKLPVCGNCHSFSADGQRAGHGRGLRQRQGLLCDPAAWPQQMVLDRRARSSPGAISGKARTKQTFGLLSQVSPDGRYVVSTVKDRSVFVATPDIWLLAALLPDQGHPGRLRPRDAAPSSPAGRRRSASTCRATRPGARRQVRSSSPGAKAYPRDKLANAQEPAAGREGCRGVPQGQADRSSSTCTAFRSTTARAASRSRSQGASQQRHEQLLSRSTRPTASGSSSARPRSLHAAAAGQRAVHHSGRGRRGPAAARATRRG